MLGSFRRLLRAYFSRPGPPILAISFGVLVISMSAVMPLLIGRAVDDVVAGKPYGVLIPTVAGLLLAALLKAAAIYVRKRWSWTASIRNEARLRAQLYEHVQGLDMAYHEQVPTGQLMSRAASDLQATREFLAMIPVTIGMLTFVSVVSVILFRQDTLLALVILGGLPIMATSAARLTRQLHPLVDSQQANLAELTATAEETVTGIRVVKAFGREDSQIKRLTKDAIRVFEKASGVVRVRATLQPLFDFFPALSLALITWVGGFRVLNGHISFGIFISFFMYMVQLQWPVRLMGWVAADGQKAATAAGRIFEVLDEKPGIEDRPGVEDLEIPGGEITFEGVSYRFDEGRRVLDGLDLEIPAGGSVALVGPTGCGKSTLLRLILRFIEPTSGRVLVDGIDISQITLESLRNQMGTVFEETFLFSETVAANIAFGRPDASEDEIVAAAVLAQAHGFISELPESYQTVVGEQGFTLSGGQRQRIAIARAILMDPRILLLDDATSAVDTQKEAEIRRGIAEAMKGRTTIIVARRPSSAALADQVVLMDRGRIVAQGAHNELWASEPFYRSVLTGDAEATVDALQKGRS